MKYNNIIDPNNRMNQLASDDDNYDNYLKAALSKGKQYYEYEDYELKIKYHH